MANFDLAAMALKAVCPTNDILYDDKGLPSVMVKIPKFKISQVIPGGADSVHPAFIVNGQEVDAIYISKYQNIVNNNRAYSLPECLPNRWGSPLLRTLFPVSSKRSPTVRMTYGKPYTWAVLTSSLHARSSSRSPCGKVPCVWNSISMSLPS